MNFYNTFYTILEIRQKSKTLSVAETLTAKSRKRKILKITILFDIYFLYITVKMQF